MEYIEERVIRDTSIPLVLFRNFGKVAIEFDIFCIGFNYSTSLTIDKHVLRFSLNSDD